MPNTRARSGRAPGVRAARPSRTAAPLAAPSPREQFPKLAELIGYLDGVKGRVDLKVLAKLLSKLQLTRKDIEGACTFGTRGYKRNTIARSEHYELLALCWRSGHCTPIHDHRGASCAFRVIEGTGTEIRFEVTPSSMVCPVATIPMAPGYVCAAADADIHQVANMQAPGRDLVTLHIYSPPISKMHTYKFCVSDGADTGKYDC